MTPGWIPDGSRIIRNPSKNDLHYPQSSPKSPRRLLMITNKYLKNDPQMINGITIITNRIKDRTNMPKICVNTPQKSMKYP